MVLKYKNGVTWKIVKKYDGSFLVKLVDTGRSMYRKDRIGEKVHFKDWEFSRLEWEISYDFQDYLKQAELC